MRPIYLAVFVLLTLDQTWASQDEFENVDIHGTGPRYQSLSQKHSSGEEDDKATTTSESSLEDQPRSFCARNKWWFIGATSVLVIGSGLGVFFAFLCNPLGPSIQGDNCTGIHVNWT